MSLQYVYKVFEEKQGKPCFMMHALNGTRYIPLNKWLHATKKMVTDFTRAKSKPYESAFHGYPTLEVALKFIKTLRVKKNRYLCEVTVVDPRKKPTKNSKAVLSDTMMLTSFQWEGRRSLEVETILDTPATSS